MRAKSEEVGGKREAQGVKSGAQGGEERAVLVTRQGLAAALKVSLRTVDAMLHDEEIVPVRLRGLVRFYLPDVIEALRNENRKWGRRADLTTKNVESAEREDGRLMTDDGGRRREAGTRKAV